MTNLELKTLSELVKELKKSIRAQRKAKTLIEEFVDAELMRQKSAFEPHVEHLDVRDTKVDEDGTIVRVDSPIMSPKDVPGYDSEINNPEPSGLN